MKPVRKKEARFAGICGISALVLGLGNVVCGSILLGYEIKNGDGLWSGFGVMLAGSLGVVIWWTKFRPAMFLFLVMCSVMAMAQVIQVALAVIRFVFWRHFTETSANCYLSYGVCRCTTSDGRKLPISLNPCDLIRIFDDVYLALIVFSILNLLVTSVGSFVGCVSTCFEDMQQSERPTTEATELETERVFKNPESESLKLSIKRDEKSNETEVKENQYDEIVVENTEVLPAPPKDS